MPRHRKADRALVHALSRLSAGSAARAPRRYPHGGYHRSSTNERVGLPVDGQLASAWVI
jgi:hypothetical protein